MKKQLIVKATKPTINKINDESCIFYRNESTFLIRRSIKKTVVKVIPKLTNKLNIYININVLLEPNSPLNLFPNY
jgi:hypothetical protein